MSKKETQEYVRAFETTYKTTFGWVFAWEYPGVFVYYKGQYAVYFTPEYSTKDMVDIQLVEGEGGDVSDGAEVPFQPRTPAGLFAIVSAFLTKIDTQPDVLEWSPKA